ncbi:hypothetical protein QWY93_08795 [Echinicola jeungdonensis]|uniref:Uncharacterized protein n=1 Tax=Echinicola jeungdonensis TaxID=709343 RepID=A0ABV5JAI2_9BACT|nr:hypothetical protein [Echinicola jeungdonensis]MDN3669426.1 hypothetical protein [Echinicola jeungdonensis]
MTSLVIYSFLFLAIFAHAMMASMMYRRIHGNEELPPAEKNAWKLKALVFPAYYWGQYKKRKA